MHRRMESDGELMRRSRRDPHAFDDVYVRHARDIHGWLARTIGDSDRAWELTAEVFARAWLARRRFRPGPDGSAGPWLQGIARNVWRHQARGRSARGRALRRLGITLDLVSPSEGDDQLERMAAEAIGPELHAALERLPHGQRVAIELRVLDELSYEVIAARLECSVEAARMRVMRGLRTLVADLGELL